MNEKVPETAAADLVAQVLVKQRAEIVDPDLDLAGWWPKHLAVAAAVLAALRNAGWVDPEEAAVWRHIKDRAIEQRDEAQRSADYYREAAVERGKIMEAAEAERDALLPVVEAARALGRHTALGPDPWRRRESGDAWRLIVEIEDQLRALIAAVDALDSEPIAPLVDVTNADFADLIDDANPALQRSIKRLVRNLDDPDGVISAFSSFVETGEPA